MFNPLSALNIIQEVIKLKFRIKELREHVGMNQTELAKCADVTRVTIWGLESGEWKDAKAETLMRIANALGCTIDDLIEVGA